MSRVALRLIACAALGAAPGCSNQADPRPQLVVIIDTNLPVAGLELSDPTISHSATIDTVRVDVIDSQGQPFDYRDFVAPDPADWPLSFGVVPESLQPGSAARLRIRGFRGALATPGSLQGVATLEPLPELAMDRLIDIVMPASGVDRVLVLLDGDCLGIPATFLPNLTTCVDGSSPAAQPSDGLVHGSDPAAPTQVGTWWRSRQVPCTGPQHPNAVCIPGGFSVLGDPELVGIGNGVNALDPVPLRPVHLSPFWMDRNEVTVGTYRKLVGSLQQPAPIAATPTDEFLKWCTWLSPDNAVNDSLALNCIAWASAQEVCKHQGGDLPTEAQWEHAARGRGQERPYPWGTSGSSCCAASVGRSPSMAACPGLGPEPVGSHPSTPQCGNIGDTSRDDVVDLAGSMSEMVRDGFLRYDHPCWAAAGILQDPMCSDLQVTSLHIQRGGNWSAGPANAHSAMRNSVSAQGTIAAGFRCVYLDGAP